jgi:hypothetical protein
VLTCAAHPTTSLRGCGGGFLRRDFGPLDVRAAEAASYVTQVQSAFDFASDETGTVTTQSVLNNWWARDVMQRETRTDGSIVMFPFNRPEAVERFLVNLRNLLKREPQTWTRNDSEVTDIISKGLCWC